MIVKYKIYKYHIEIKMIKLKCIEYKASPKESCQYLVKKDVKFTY